MGFMKVIRRTDELVNILMPAILCGVLTEGDALPSDQQLGSQHNVSRTVVREAFRILGAIFRLSFDLFLTFLKIEKKNFLSKNKLYYY